jgi:hypothetical protein
MSYSYLGQNLHETADRAKQYFIKEYGARNFECEEAVDDLPLKPTWQATSKAGYLLCIEVRETPFSNSLYEFVAKCAARGIPVRLWVAIPEIAAGPTFNAELKQARDFGVGVVQLPDTGAAHEFHRPVSLSLFALKKTDLSAVPKAKREEVKSAESTFLDGTPDQGCQAICQALEKLTREFSEHTYNQGWWRQPKGSKLLKPKFFQNDSWAIVLQLMEERLDIKKVQLKCDIFTKQAIVKARAHTDWRNAVSHKPKTIKQLKERDARLRTMFETTRDILIEWYVIAKPLKLIR